MGTLRSLCLVLSAGLTAARPLALLAALAAILLAGAEARASCGDYLHAASDASGQSAKSEQGPRPCTGPNCSAAPDPAPLLPTPSAPAAPRNNAAIPSGLPRVSPDASSRGERPASDLLPPSPARAPIYHPPR